MAKEHWKSISTSRFPWEQEALDFVHAGFPAQDTYSAWSSFEFVADDGSINEVDLLVACPQGVFLIEIKSKPGVVGVLPVYCSGCYESGGRREAPPGTLIT